MQLSHLWDNLSLLADYTLNRLDFSSGANDIVVIQDTRGHLRSTPFHIRFGRWKRFGSQSKRVSIEINGSPVDMSLYLGEDGYCYWLSPDSSVIDNNEDPIFGIPVLGSPRGIETYESGWNNKARKSLFPTECVLRELAPHEGKNVIRFLLDRDSNTCRDITANIFRWREDAQLVISDIDGTITRSDILGHILSGVGKDWTRQGTCAFYQRVARNGYHFIYLTSQTLGQQEQTRKFLTNVRQGDRGLPDGPVVVAPDLFFSGFQREVYHRPYESKIALLQSLGRCFPKGCHPFSAAFGNTVSDVVAYTSVGIPSSRILILTKWGTVLLGGVESSYVDLNELVELLFPPLVADSRCIGSPFFNSYHYWRMHLSSACASEFLKLDTNETVQEGSNKLFSSTDCLPGTYLLRNAHCDGFMALHQAESSQEISAIVVSANTASKSGLVKAACLWYLQKCSEDSSLPRHYLINCISRHKLSLSSHDGLVGDFPEQPSLKYHVEHFSDRKALRFLDAKGNALAVDKTMCVVQKSLNELYHPDAALWALVPITVDEGSA